MPVRLDDQEEHDQRAEHHVLQVVAVAVEIGRPIQCGTWFRKRQQDEEGRAKDAP